MTDKVQEKKVKQLRIERTVAKCRFTSQAKFISRGVSKMVQVELKEEFTLLSDRFRTMLKANENYKIGLKAAEEVPGEQQEADLLNYVEEAETKLADMRDIIQTNLWSRYGESELEMAIAVAEEASDYAQNVPVVSANLEAYEVHLTLVERWMKEVISATSTWESWILAISQDYPKVHLVRL